MVPRNSYSVLVLGLRLALCTVGRVGVGVVILY